MMNTRKCFNVAIAMCCLFIGLISCQQGCRNTEGQVVFVLDALYLGAHRTGQITSTISDVINRLDRVGSPLNVGFLLNGRDRGNDVQGFDMTGDRDRILGRLDIMQKSGIVNLVKGLKDFYYESDSEKIAVLFVVDELDDEEINEVRLALRTPRHMQSVVVYLVAVGNIANNRGITSILDVDMEPVERHFINGSTVLNSDMIFSKLCV